MTCSFSGYRWLQTETIQETPKDSKELTFDILDTIRHFIDVVLL